LAKKVVDSGDLMPDFMPVHLWSNILTEKFTGNENLIFDGTPRKLSEAKVFDSIFPFYSLDNPWVIHLNIEHSESAKRLSLRAVQAGRVDDGKEAIEERKKAFEQDVEPVIEWYRVNPKVLFLDINGNRPVEEIHADIVKKAGLE
jgi:adenylate kinase